MIKETWQRRHGGAPLPPELRYNYLTTKRAFKDALREAKHSAWTEFIEEMNEGGPQDVWINMKNMNTKIPPLVLSRLLEANGQTVQGPDNIASAMVSKFCSPLAEYEAIVARALEEENGTILGTQFVPLEDPITLDELYTF